MSHPINPAYLAEGKKIADQLMEAAFGRQPVSTSENAAPVPASNRTRQPLGRRNPAEINHTLLRVVGKTPALGVAAFQSFAD